MRVQAKNAAYAAVGTADVTIEKVRETVKGVSTSARRAGKVLDEMERRGRKVVGRAKTKTKRKSTAALRTSRAGRSGSARSGTATRTRSRAGAAPRRSAARSR